MSHELILDLRGVGVALSQVARKSVGPTLRMESRLTPGCHAVVVQSPDQADALIRTCAGLQKAKRGRPKIGGKNPYTSPRSRMSIVSLLAEEIPTDEWSDTQTVAQVVTAVVSGFEAIIAQGDGPRRNPLEHLEALKTRSFSSLNNEQRRTIMLELALCHPAPQLALLYQPWSTITGSEYPELRLLSEIRRLVRQNCIVVLLSVSEEQAERYSSRLIQPSLEYTRRTLMSLGANR